MNIDIAKFAADPLAFFSALLVPAAQGANRFGEVMADFQRDWFQAVAPSLLAVAAGNKPPIGRYWSERTKGASKDSDCACILLWLLAFSRQKLDMQVGAADKEQAGELKKAAADILRLNGWLAQRVEVQTWSLVCRATGSECAILASDVAGSHGARPDIVVMNELSHVTKEEFSQNLLDNASKKPHGLVFIATNAGFVGSWQSRWRDLARTSDRWNFHSYTQPAPWLSEAELAEAAKRNSSNRFNRLFWGHWVSQAGDALDDDDLQAAINPQLQPGLVRYGEFYIAGLDLGIKHDHSAFVVLAGSHSTLQLRLVWAQNWKPDSTTGKVDLMAVERALLVAHHRYGFRAVPYDPHQAELMAQRLAARGVPMQPMQFVGANLNLMASTLLEVFRSRRLELYNHPGLVEDLGRLTIEEKSYGHRLSATRTESGHADLATSLAIALPIAVEAAGKPPVVLGRPLFDETIDCHYGLSPYDEAQRRQEEYQREQQQALKDMYPSESESLIDALRSGNVRIGRPQPLL